MNRNLRFFSLVLLIVFLAAGTSAWKVQAQGKEPITPANADRVTQLAVLGYGYSTDVAWSPDGKTLVVGTSAGLLLYDAMALQVAPPLHEVSVGAVNSVGFSTDGRLLAVGGKNGLLLWDRITEQERPMSSVETGGEVLGVAFSPDGATLAAGSPGDTVRLWDVVSGKLRLALKGHDQAVTNVAFSPDGKFLAASGGYDGGLAHNDGTIHLWNAVTGELVTVLGGSADKLTGVAFSPDGMTLATGSYDNTVRLWDMATGKLRASMKGHTGDVVSVTFSPDGTMLASSAGWEDSAVRLWDVASGSLLRILKGCVRSAHMGEMGKVVFSPDGATLASTCSDTGVMLWDVATGQSHSISQAYSGAIWSVAFSPDGTNLVTSGGNGWTGPGSVRLWDVAAGRERAVLQGHTAWVRSVAFSPDGKLIASGSGDRTVRLWDTTTGELHRTIGRLSDADWGTIAFGDDDGDVRLTQAVFSDAVWSVAFSPDGKTLAVGRGDPMGTPGSFQVYDVATGRLIRDVRPKSASETFTLGVYSLAFSPDGTLLAIVNGHGNVQLWDVVTGQKRADLVADTDWHGSRAVFSPDGTVVAASGTWSDCNGWAQTCRPEDEHGQTLLWNVASGKQFAVLEGNVGGEQSVTFSPDGQILASARGWDDGSVRLWDVTNRKLLAVLKDQSVASVAFSPDGTTLVTGSWGGTVRLWGVPLGK